MHIGQAFDLVSRYNSLRKRRLSLEMMVWCIVGMALPPFIR
ncbi:transposase domain-containing protein [Salmonella enterica]